MIAGTKAIRGEAGDATDPESKSSSSDVGGFSDCSVRESVGVPLGHGHKLVFENLPVLWNEKNDHQFLINDHDSIKYVGARVGKAAVFINTEQEAQDMAKCLHRTLVLGSVLSVKLEEPADLEEMLDEGFEPNVYSESTNHKLQVEDFVELTVITSESGKRLNG